MSRTQRDISPSVNCFLNYQPKCFWHALLASKQANERHQSSVRFFFHSLLWFYSCDAMYRTIPRMFESKRNCADWYLESFSWMRTVEKLSHLTSSALYHEMHSIQSSTSELEHWTLIFPLSSSSSSSGALNGIVCAFGAMLLWTLDWRWKLSKKYRKCMFWCTRSNLIKTPLISSHSTRIWICSAALVSHINSVAGRNSSYVFFRCCSFQMLQVAVCLTLFFCWNASSCSIITKTTCNILRSWYVGR